MGQEEVTSSVYPRPGHDVKLPRGEPHHHRGPVHLVSPQVWYPTIQYLQYVTTYYLGYNHEHFLCCSNKYSVYQFNY